MDKRVRECDTQYSEWLCMRESVRATTVKPSGSVSILSGETPGVHWGPGGKHFLRAIRFSDKIQCCPSSKQRGTR